MQIKMKSQYNSLLPPSLFAIFLKKTSTLANYFIKKLVFSTKGILSVSICISLCFMRPTDIVYNLV